MCYFEGVRTGAWNSSSEWMEECRKTAQEMAGVEPAAPAALPAPSTTVRKCGVCRQPGHNRKKCPQTAAAPAAAADAPPPPPPETWVKLPGKSYTFPPGRYYFGDICYPLQSDASEWYDKVWGGEFNYDEGIFQKGAITMAVFRTAYGDGGYPGSDGHEYSVDAGVIGFVPVSMFSETEFLAGYTSGPGRIIDYKTKVKFTTDGFGHFTVAPVPFGGGQHIEIRTAGCDEDEDEY